MTFWVTVEIPRPNDRFKAKAASVQQFGRFTVSLPTQADGINGRGPTDVGNRAIISANPSDANDIKDALRGVRGVKVRIMKRKDGVKVYIDATKQSLLDDALDVIENI